MVSPDKSLLQIRYQSLTELKPSRDSVPIRPWGNSGIRLEKNVVLEITKLC